jgi:hypothetical protein
MSTQRSCMKLNAFAGHRCTRILAGIALVAVQLAPGPGRVSAAESTGGNASILRDDRLTNQAAPAVDRAGASSDRGIIRFQRVSIKDDERMIGGEAAQMLMPADWKLEGGVRWRAHPALPAYVMFKATSPSGLEILEVLPTQPFVWTEGGIPFFPSGSTYLGNEVAAPVTDPVVFIKQYVLPRFRPGLGQMKIVTTEELPKVAAAVAAANQEPGVTKTFRAARVRLEYRQRDRLFEEDIYCVLTAAWIPMVKSTFWGSERTYSFKAEKGDLDEKAKLFQTMAASFRPNLQWFNKYMQLVDVLVKAQLQQIRQAGELSRYISKTSEEISDIRRKAYENRQASQDRISANFSQYIRGVDEYRSPGENRTVELPSGFKQAWANPLGEYIVSDDANFNPNIDSNLHWERLERKN